MAITGVGNGYHSNAYHHLYAAKSNEAESAAPAEKAGTQVSAADAASVGLEFIQSVERQNSGTKFFVGTVSYGQTYGNSTDTNFVVNPKYLSKLGSDTEAQKQFEEDVKYLHHFFVIQPQQFGDSSLHV